VLGSGCAEGTVQKRLKKEMLKGEKKREKDRRPYLAVIPLSEGAPKEMCRCHGRRFTGPREVQGIIA